MTATVISIANQKGGVGKTTTAINLAAGLAIKGYKTLLIDLDSQCNATYSYLDVEQVTVTLADVLVGYQDRQPLQEAIYTTHIVGLDIVPAHIRLAMIERQVQIDEQYRLKECLDGLGSYQFVVIDCPPSLGVTLTQALLASNYVIVPIAAAYYPVEGVVDLNRTIESTRKANTKLSVLGYLITDYDGRTNAAKDAAQRIIGMFGEKVFDVIIRKNTKLVSAPAYKKTIYEHDQDSTGSSDYFDLTDECFLRLNMKSNLSIVKEA